MPTASQNEQSTWCCAAWQAKGDPSKLVHLFTFEDEEAYQRHGQSEAVKQFESVYEPELVGRPVVFTDYQLVATNGGTTR